MEDNKDFNELDVNIEEKNVEDKNDFERGLTMLKNALKRYEDDDIEGAEKDRQLANELLDKGKKEQITATEIDDDEVYTESRNFGIIYNVFENNAKKMFDGKKFTNPSAIKNIIKTIKSDKVLKEQFEVYNTLANKVVNGDSETYLTEALSLLPSLNKKEIIQSNNKLIGIMRKNGLDETVEINADKRALYEAIEYVMLNGKKLSNIEEYNQNRETIKENLETNKTKQTQVLKTKEECRAEIDSIIEKHSKNISEEGKQIFEDIANNNGQSVFEKYKNQAIELISEEITKSENVSDKLDWTSVLTKTTLKQYNQDRILEDISSFVGIINLLTE